MIPGVVMGNDPEGKSHATWNLDDYKTKREEETGRELNPKENETIDRGCIGITAEQLNAVNPPLDRCYSTFEKALSVAQALNKSLRDSGESEEKKAIIFSKRFYSGGADYSPDPDGKVNMSGYNYEAKPGFTNFDYGYYDETTGKWWHANHKEPGMEVYESTLEYYSRALLDFDEQVFCVAIQPAK